MDGREIKGASMWEHVRLVSRVITRMDAKTQLGFRRRVQTHFLGRRHVLVCGSGARSLLLRAPGDVVGPRGCAVLVDQVLHHLPRVVQLVEVVLEHVLLTELLQEGLAFPQLIVLTARPLKQLGGGGRKQTSHKRINTESERIRAESEIWIALEPQMKPRWAEIITSVRHHC